MYMKLYLAFPFGIHAVMYNMCHSSAKAEFQPFYPRSGLDYVSCVTDLLLITALSRYDAYSTSSLQETSQLGAPF